LAVGLLIALGAVGMSYQLSAPNYPSTSSVEAGFARDMETHHAQAVEMALIIRDKTTDPTLRAISYDIVTTQQQQIGQMYAWLELWGLSHTSTTPPMTWMSSGGSSMKAMRLLPDGRMPGMASATDLARLKNASGRPAERQFLTLMIIHHRAGIAMAKTALASSDRPEVQRLASSIVRAQRAEISQLQDLLSSRRTS